ncbi:MAG: glycosyltransferase [Austwickia sp.]|nr:glycosyltransferase [Austwickia sp.]MBK9100958.1 glycosyltransferase [Austwickia sp.]
MGHEHLFGVNAPDRSVRAVNAVGSRIPVLRYVGIQGCIGVNSDAVTRAVLLAHLDRLDELGVKVLNMAEAARLVTQWRPPTRAVVLTFDIDQPCLAWLGPILAERSMGATAFVTTALIAGGTHSAETLPPNPLTWSDVVALRDAGFEVASSGHTRTTVKSASSVEVLDELLMSKALLEDAMGTPVLSFAVPPGWSGQHSAKGVAVSGFTSAVVDASGVWCVGDGTYAVPRITVTADFDLDGVLASRNGAPAAPAAPRDRLRAALALGGRSAPIYSPTVSFRRTMFSVDVLSGEASTPAAAPTVPAPRTGIAVVRMHGRPIGQVEVDTATPWTLETLADRVRQRAWTQLRREIDAHLAADEIRPVDDPAELSAVAEHVCASRFAVDPASEPMVSVIVTTMDNEEVCARTIRHVLASSYRNFEVLVVDNRPKGSALRASLTRAGLLSNRVRVVDEPRQGLSCARNMGIAHAAGEIIAIIDDDVTVDRLWLAALVGHFVADPEVGCVTGGILPAEVEAPAQVWLEQYSGYHRGYDIQRFDIGPNRPDDAIYPYNAGRFGSGANVAFRADVLRGLGGFSEDLGAGTPAEGCEDIDILRRVVTSGSRLVYEPAAMVWHAHRRVAGQVRRTLYRYGVGLSAMLTRWLLESPQVRRDMLAKFSRGARYLLSSDSNKNENKTQTFPSELTRVELLGVAFGPGLLLRSRRVTRKKGKLDLSGPVQPA